VWVFVTTSSAALDPIVGFGIVHGLPPFIPLRDQRFLAGNAKRKVHAACRYELSYGFTMAGDDDGFALLHQFQQAGELSHFMNVDLHANSLVSSLS
jgi:hypothetical protein